MQKQRQILLALGRYDTRIHIGVTRYALKVGWHVSTNFTNSIKLSFWRESDGLIFNHWPPEDFTAIDQIDQLPKVSLIQGHYGKRCGQVIQDNLQIGNVAAEHLLERKFDQFAAILLNHNPVEDDRLANFAQSITQAGFPCHIRCWEDDREKSPTISPMKWLKRQIKKIKSPTAIFVPNDELAIEVINACSDYGLDVPKHVAVIGADNCSVIAETSEIPLSSVDGNHEQWGFEAAMLLDRLMQGEPAPVHPILVCPGEVVRRKSTDTLAIDHDGVAKAIRFIWDNFHQPIDVGDVLEAVGPITRRGLEKAFQRHLNRSPAQEILRMRLKRAKKLILEDQFKTSEIARLSGFRDAEHLRDIFHRHVGMAPRNYRQVKNETN